MSIFRDINWSKKRLQEELEHAPLDEIKIQFLEKLVPRLEEASNKLSNLDLDLLSFESNEALAKEKFNTAFKECHFLLKDLSSFLENQKIEQTAILRAYPYLDFFRLG